MYINFDSVSSQRRMNEENLAKQEESVRKQEAMKRGSLVAFYLSLRIFMIDVAAGANYSLRQHVFM